MQEKSWGFFKYTAAGCGGCIVICVVLVFGLAATMMVPFHRAMDARTTIDDRFGSQDEYVPPPFGAASPERVELFIGVRRALVGACEPFAHAEEQVAILEGFDGQPDVNQVTAVKQAFSTSRTMMGLGAGIARYYEARNQALLDAEMGLGEFTYLYVMAYHDEIRNPSSEPVLFGPDVANRRVRRALQTMLEAQLAALGSDHSGGEGEALSAEIEALENDPGRLLWQDGLPAAIQDAFAPYRNELDSVFCPAASPLELMINETRGPAIQGI